MGPLLVIAIAVLFVTVPSVFAYRDVLHCNGSRNMALACMFSFWFVGPLGFLVWWFARRFGRGRSHRATTS